LRSSVKVLAEQKRVVLPSKMGRVETSPTRVRRARRVLPSFDSVLAADRAGLSPVLRPPTDLGCEGGSGGTAVTLVTRIVLRELYERFSPLVTLTQVSSTGSSTTPVVRPSSNVVHQH